MPNATLKWEFWANRWVKTNFEGHPGISYHHKRALQMVILRQLWDCCVVNCMDGPQNRFLLPLGQKSSWSLPKNLAWLMEKSWAPVDKVVVRYSTTWMGSSLQTSETKFSPLTSKKHPKFFFSTKSIFQSTQGKLNSCEKCFRSHTCGRDIAIENGRWRTLALQYQEISRAFYAARAWIYK